MNTHSDTLVEQEPGSKAERARKAIRELATARGPGAKLPTLQEMCGQLRVSRTTLERALAPLERQGLLRRRQGSGIYVRDEATLKTVGVVFGGNIFDPRFSPFWGLMLQAVRTEAGARQLLPRSYLDVSHTGVGVGSDNQLIEDLEAHRLDGMLLLAPRSAEDGERLAASGLPLVVFSSEHRGWSVTHDSRDFLTRAAEALGRRGCRRVALIGMAAEADFVQVERELARAGDARVQLLDWSWTRWVQSVPAASREAFGFELTRRRLDARAGDPLPEGIISYDDTITRGVLTALERGGVRPGQDIQIATSGNKGSSVISAYEGELILFEFDPCDSVRAGLDMLETLMDGGTPAHNPVLVRAHEKAPKGRQQQ